MTEIVSITVTEVVEDVSISANVADNISIAIAETVEDIALSVNITDDVAIAVVETVEQVALSTVDNTENVALSVIETTEQVALTVVETGIGEGFPDPDQIDETDATYFYFGWESFNGSWLIERQLRSTSSSEIATIVLNSGYADLTAAWTDRATLVYA